MRLWLVETTTNADQHDNVQHYTWSMKIDNVMKFSVAAKVHDVGSYRILMECDVTTSAIFHSFYRSIYLYIVARNRRFQIASPPIIKTVALTGGNRNIMIKFWTFKILLTPVFELFKTRKSSYRSIDKRSDCQASNISIIPHSIL